MFAPTRLTVEGFRGFRETEQFEFDQPVTELFGDNGCGKSCTLNAIEWALFGDGCTGKQTGIRERVDWVVANRDLSPPAVKVHLEMVGAEGTYAIIRTLRRPPRKTTLKEDLELTLPDGTKLAGDAASEKLGGLIRSSFRDFLTTVYQHQEVIRAVLTQEPKDRNDAIDRLLGLSDKRNLLSALDGADLRGRHKDIGKKYDAFEAQVRIALETRERDLITLRVDAQKAGLAPNQISSKAALSAAEKIRIALHDFAKEAELKSNEVPVPDAWPGLVDFERLTSEAISRLRGQVPGITEQENLLKRQRKLLALREAFDDLRKRWDDLGPKTRSLDKLHGGQTALQKKLAGTEQELNAEKEQLRQTSGQGAVVNEAMKFLSSVDEDTPCPVCETPIPALAIKVKEMWDKKFEPLVEEHRREIEKLEKDIKELKRIARQYKELNDEAESLKPKQVELTRDAAKLLNKELGDDDNPLNLVIGELEGVNGRLQQLAKAIQERQDRLDKIAQDLDRIWLVRRYLQDQEKKQSLEKIKQSATFKQLESIRDQAAEFVEDSEALKKAIAEAACQEAEAKLASAKQTIAEYFNHLSGNPAVGELEFDVTPDKRTGRNSYAITGHDGNDLAPILGQGDLNALALAIFLGLAAAAKNTGVFQFLMLDDPSQSLDSAHKKQLALLLDQVARHKRVIVATMDAEFHGYLTACLTKATRLYRFEKWTPEEGPFIRR